MTNVTKWKSWGDKRTSRNQNWSELETATLIDVWARYVDILKLHRRTGKIYEKMAGEFAHCGFNRTAIELQKKVSNLTQEYRKEKTKMNNGLGPSKWKFYHIVEDNVGALSSKTGPPFYSSTKTESSSNMSGSDTTMDDDVQFMAVYLNEPPISDEDEEDDDAPSPVATLESPMPVIVSVHSEGVNQRSMVLSPAPSRLPAPPPIAVTASDASHKELQSLKTDMHRALEESLNIHRQQVTLQQRQIILQEDMLKIMAKFIDQCP